MTCYLSVVEVHAVHGQLLGIFQEVHLCFGWCHPPDRAEHDRSDKVNKNKYRKRDLMLSEQYEYSTFENPIRSKTGIIQFYGIKAFGKLLFLWMLLTEAQQSTMSASIF